MIPNWSRLDNAAKIYPASSSKTDTHVFRFSCELYEDIDAQTLQAALDEAIKIFPAFQYALRHGLFWFYLEDTDIMPVVKEEYKPPCSELYHSSHKTLLYEITYFGRIINFEIYHVLTDGTGAISFFRVLIAQYLTLKYNLPPVPVADDASHMQMTDDSFHKYYNKSAERHKDVRPRAMKLHGQRFAEDRIKIIRGTVSVKAALSAARAHNATITTFLAACLLDSINKESIRNAKGRPIVLSIPVNLRNFFESASARNFFSNIYTGYSSTADSDSLDDIIKTVNEDFTREITVQKLTDKLNGFCALENNVAVRLTPLVLKNIILKQAYRITASKSTAILSNVGVIKMPAELTPYIRAFDVCTGTGMCLLLRRPAVNQLHLALCQFGHTATIFPRAYGAGYERRACRKQYCGRITALCF